MPRIARVPIVLLSTGAIVAAGSFAGCIDRYPRKGGAMSGRTIEQVQAEYTDEWMAIDGVEGVAIGLFEDKPCIRIFSSRNPRELRDEIPSGIEGYPVIIEDTGSFRALDQ